MSHPTPRIQSMVDFFLTRRPATRSVEIIEHSRETRRSTDLKSVEVSVLNVEPETNRLTT